MTMGMLIVLSPAQATAQITILHSFGDGTVPNDGAYPQAALVEGPDGNFTGVTATQAEDLNGNNCTVFQIGPSGGSMFAQSFRTARKIAFGQPLTYYNGELVGVAFSGPQTNGSGAVFGLLERPRAQQWRCEVWRRFPGDPNAGVLPDGSVILGSDGNLYGTTLQSNFLAGGSVYRLNPKSHVVTVLYTFTLSGPMYPTWALLQANDGNFYGTTTEFAFNLTAAIFKLTPSGEVTALYQVPGSLSTIGGPLIQASDGNLYGTSGSSGTDGTVFRISLPGDVVSPVYAFQGSDGSGPAGLVQGTDGYLYGVTYAGGSAGKGVVFKLSTDGSSYTVLHNFGDGAKNGANPIGPLVFGSDSDLYGVTEKGGSAGLGTVFKISP
jgi:uncharacterized repeat protein (TIGR03803 family)